MTQKSTIFQIYYVTCNFFYLYLNIFIKNICHSNNIRYYTQIVKATN